MLNEVNLIDNEDTFKVLQLSSLIVATPYRNQGIGKALVQAVEEACESSSLYCYYCRWLS